MITKIFEIRDGGTFIRVLAVLMVGSSPTESWYLRREGYTGNVVAITPLSGNKVFTANPHRHFHGRAMSVAHTYIQECFFEMETGDVVDVQFIFGETKVLKYSERFSD